MNNKHTFIKNIILSAFLFMTIVGKGQVSNLFDEAIETTKQIKTTSPFILDDQRINLIKRIQVYADGLTDITFKDEYLAGTEQKSVDMENSIPVLYFYRDAFDTVLKELQTKEAPKDSVIIWSLYNMGIIVRTPSGCYGIDVNHRWAERLEPYLDFICVTHNHNDHTSTLMSVMRSKGKPVLSNFFKDDARYCSTVPSNYKIGNFHIRTDITDHDATLPNFVTVFRIESDGFSILHCGDSNFVPEQYVNTIGKVNLLIFFNTESVDGNQIIAPNLITPDYVALSHFVELRHKVYVSPKRYSLISGLNAISTINCKNTILPLWGEKMSWQANSQFQGGTGTEEDPFLISTPDHLENMRRYTAVNSTSNNGKPIKYFKLTADIDLSNIPNWLPLSFNLGGSNQGYAFMHLDGNGHIIKNMTSIYPGTGTAEYWSFAGILCGSIKNLGFVNVNVSSTNYPGAIAGAVGRTTPTAGLENLQLGYIENCYASGIVKGTGRVGGITGQIGSKGSYIKNCYSTCDVTNTGTAATCYTGGIVGSIVGNATNNTIGISYIDNCYATGSITAEKGYVGGITGGVIGGDIRNCVAYNKSITMKSAESADLIGTITATIDATSHSLFNNNNTYNTKKNISMIRGGVPYTPSNFSVAASSPFDGAIKDDIYLSNRSNYPFLTDQVWANDLVKVIYPQLLWVSQRIDAADIDGLQSIASAITYTFAEKNNVRTKIMFNGLLNIQAKEVIQRVEIFNLNGQVIHTGNYQNSEIDIDISSYPSTIYFIKVISAERISTAKVVKK